MAEKLTAREKQWRAEGDAECLAQANVIKEDKERFAAAQKVAQQRASQLEKQAKELKKVAKKK